MRLTIGFKIFGIAVGLLLLMSAVALLNMHLTRTVDAQLDVVNRNYIPGFAALEQAHIRKLEESSTSRRLISALEQGDKADPQEVMRLRRRVAAAAKAADAGLADARRSINDQIANPLDFGDDIALARLDTRIGFLEQEREHYEALLSKLLVAAQHGAGADTSRLLTDLDTGATIGTGG